MTEPIDTDAIIDPASLARPQLLEQIDPKPTGAARARMLARRTFRIGGVIIGVLAVLTLAILVRAYFESRWTLPETRTTARIEEDLYYSLTYQPSSGDILGINFTTDEIIHLGDPEGGIEGVQARVERNQTENRHSYQINNDRDLLVASATQVLVSNRPLFDKTALISQVEHGFILSDDPDAERAKAFTAYDLRGKRLHEQSRTVLLPGSPRTLVNAMIERSEFWGWFGDYFRSGSRLIEFSNAAPADLVARFSQQHQEFHDEQKLRLGNPFDTLRALEAHSRPLFTSDEGLPGPWWQFDALPQGSTMHLHSGDGSSEKVRISWDKTGIFPWHWLNGGYLARDSVGELFQIRIRDYWFHFDNQLTYLYFLDLDGNGHIDRETELIGQVHYKVADSPLKESFSAIGDAQLTQENTQEFTRNKTFVFRIGADPTQAARDFRLCDAIEKLLPDAIHKGFGRDSHLGYIERARDDFILSEDLSAATLHSAVSIEDGLAWKDGVVTLLRAARRPYADALERYYFADPAFSAGRR